MGLCENIFYSMDTMEEEFGRCMHGCSSIFVFLRAYSTAHVYINPNTYKTYQKSHASVNKKKFSRKLIHSSHLLNKSQKFYPLILMVLHYSLVTCRD